MSYEEILCDANTLYKAYLASVKTSKWKESTQKIILNYLTYIFKISDDLKNRTLVNDPTDEFSLHERGKIRPITSLTTKDRIVRHALCDEVLLPKVRNKIIYDNGASIKGKLYKKINPKRVVCFRRKIKKLAIKDLEGTSTYENVENTFKSWMGAYYKLLTKVQRENLITLYEDLFNKRIDIVNKKMVITNKE